MRYKITKLFSLIIGIEACLVISGWIWGIDALTRILPDGINMKFTTALTFLFAAVGLYFLAKLIEENYEPSQAILPGISLIIFLMMTALLATGLTGGQTGLESLFVRGQSPSTIFGSGMPSIPTTINFILFGLACILSLFTDSGRYKRLALCGYVIFFVGTIAVVGYALNLSFLYYQFTPSSVPIAFNTALTFVLLGLGLLFISKNETRDEA